MSPGRNPSGRQVRRNSSGRHRSWPQRNCCELSCLTQPTRRRRRPTDAPTRRAQFPASHSSGRPLPARWPGQPSRSPRAASPCYGPEPGSPGQRFEPGFAVASSGAFLEGLMKPRLAGLPLQCFCASCRYPLRTGRPDTAAQQQDAAGKPGAYGPDQQVRSLPMRALRAHRELVAAGGAYAALWQSWHGAPTEQAAL